MTEETQPTIDDLIAEAETHPYRSILEIWRAVLAPANGERHSRITPQWANRIVTSYRGIEFADMVRFRDKYFELVIDLGSILDHEIESDDECLNVTSAEEDASLNSAHYLNVLFNWQKYILQEELDWDPLHVDAAITIAALSEVHKMFFEQTGLSGLLDQINFEFTDTDRELLASELEDLKNLQEG